MEGKNEQYKYKEVLQFDHKIQCSMEELKIKEEEFKEIVNR